MKPKASVKTEYTDSEAVVLDKASGQVHHLNETASVVWRGLDDGLSVDEIASQLTDSFDVTFEMALTDVGSIVTNLSEVGLLVDSSEIDAAGD